MFTSMASSPSALLARSLDSLAVRPERKRGEEGQASEGRKLMSVLAAADDLATCHEANSLLGRAVELARECVGLERVALYIRDYEAGRIVLRGTWGTGARGQTTDEHGFHHEISLHDCNALCHLQASGSCGLYIDTTPLVAEELGRHTVIGSGWLVVTPLVIGRELIGVMYNDAAISGAAVDEGRQARAAILCSVLASLLLSRRGSVIWRPLPPNEHSPLVRRILQALHEDPLVSGERLAEGIGISPGHLARSFKREIGTSLVEYRNRLRMERFFATIERGSTNLLNAALEAGFGSYAQFHRVHRKLLGTTPKDYLMERKRGVPLTATFSRA
jgi:AraC-like DNA-binding protein